MCGKKKLTLCLALVFAVNILIIAISQTAWADIYKRGSGGQDVADIQTALKEKGFYFGEIDGVFGNGTENAIRAFQQENGLESNGVADKPTIDALGIGIIPEEEKPAVERWNGVSILDVDLSLLARLIAAEARGEPYEGQVAVGAVALNRMENPAFPNTLAGVIYQDGAFPGIFGGQINLPIPDSALRAARDALGGADPTGGAVYFLNPATGDGTGMRKKSLNIVIGSLRFYS